MFNHKIHALLIRLGWGVLFLCLMGALRLPSGSQAAGGPVASGAGNTTGGSTPSGGSLAGTALVRLLPERAAAVALAHLQETLQKGWAPEWDGASLGEPQPLAGVHGSVYAYLFRVSAPTGPAGYIIVALNQYNQPQVVEYSQSGGDPLAAGWAALERRSAELSRPAAGGMPVYLGDQQFLWELQPEDGQRTFYSAVVDDLQSLPTDIEAEMKDFFWVSEPTGWQGSHIIAGVPEWWQYRDPVWPCYNGCVPTSVATVYGYWDTWFPNLIGSSWHDAATWLQARPKMEFNCKNLSGYATWDGESILQYASERGYAFTGGLVGAPEASLLTSEIDNDRPMLFAFSRNGYWSEPHAVVGIGYEDAFLVVRDNYDWDGKNESTHRTISYPTHAFLFCPPGHDCAPKPPPLVCPEEGGVILYKYQDYRCANQPEGKGYMLFNQSGMQNTTPDFNDQASSIRVPANWSVLLFEHANGQGGRYCVNQTGLSSFSSATFDNGVPLGENVSSFQVYTRPGCAPSTPNNVTDNTPPSGAYSAPGWGTTVGRTVTLRANASDVGSGVARVVFSGSYNGLWRILGEDTAAPFEFTWDLCAAGIPDGEIPLSLLIVDRAGNRYNLPVTEHNQITKSHNCAPEPSMWLWNGKYWNDKNFGGGQAASNVIGGPSPYLFLFWGGGAPTGGVNSDNWSARFTQTFYFPGDTYRFHCQHDDGCRIFVDGQNWIDAWWDGYGGHDMARYISPGNHTLTVEYYDNNGDARLEVWWQGAGYMPHDVLPGDASEYSHYWRAEYWVLPEMRNTTPQFTRLEGETLDNNWGSGGPDPMLPVDNFRAKFTRLEDFDCGDYRFTIYADDGVKFTLDDQLLLDQWQDQAAYFTVDRALTRGEHSLRIDYYERGGGAAISLGWQKLSDCDVSLTPQYLSSQYVKPGASFAPTVRFQVDSGYLDPLRDDQLAWAGGSSFGGSFEYLRDLVNPGQSYSFDANSPDPFWLSTNGYDEGIYNSQWRARLGNGKGVGPIYDLPVVVDGTPPDLSITSHHILDGLTRGLVSIEAEAVDSLSGVEEVEFFAGYADSSGAWSWRRLGSDRSGGGPGGAWYWIWDTSGLPAQANIVLATYAWDRARNGRFAIVDALRLEGSSSGGGGSKIVFLPVMTNGAGGPAPSPITVTLPARGEDAELGNLDCASWVDCRSATGGNFLLSDLPAGSIASAYVNALYHIKRIHLFFDLGAIPAGATIQSASLHLRPGQYLEGNTTLYLVRSTASLPLNADSYAAIVRTPAASGVASANTWLTIPLPAGLLSALPPGGLGRLAVLSAADYSGSAPAGNDSIVISMSEDSAYHPYLVVTYLP